MLSLKSKGINQNNALKKYEGASTILIYLYQRFGSNCNLKLDKPVIEPSKYYTVNQKDIL